MNLIGMIQDWQIITWSILTAFQFYWSLILILNEWPQQLKMTIYVKLCEKLRLINVCKWDWVKQNTFFCHSIVIYLRVNQGFQANLDVMVLLEILDHLDWEVLKVNLQLPDLELKVQRFAFLSHLLSEAYQRWAWLDQKLSWRSFKALYLRWPIYFIIKPWISSHRNTTSYIIIIIILMTNSVKFHYNLVTCLFCSVSVILTNLCNLKVKVEVKVSHIDLKHWGRVLIFGFFGIQRHRWLMPFI